MTDKTTRKSTNKHEWTAEQERIVREKHAILKCGITRLSRALPEIDRRLIVAMFDRFALKAECYFVWSVEEEERLIARHTESGWSGKRLFHEFPGATPSVIDSKLTELRRQNRIARKAIKPKVHYSNAQWQKFRDFVIANRFTYRIPELTERWNAIAVSLGYPAASLDMVRHLARRRLKKQGRMPATPEGAFAKADRDRKLSRFKTNAKKAEDEATKLHDAAKLRAAETIKKAPKTVVSHCRWCNTDFPFNDDYFKVKNGELESGICIWCRNRHRRELYRATQAGPAALASYKKRMKQETRKRFHDQKWATIKAARLQERERLSQLKRPPKEQQCISCNDSFPLQEPFYAAPPEGATNFDRICCFCQHDYKLAIDRAKADGQNVEAIRAERKALILRANRQLREAKKNALLRLARNTRGERAPCPKCNVPWPITPAEKFWRIDKEVRRCCLPCAWQHDAERNATGRKRKKTNRNH
jgi:hypothetical protein